MACRSELLTARFLTVRFLTIRCLTIRGSSRPWKLRPLALLVLTAACLAVWAPVESVRGQTSGDAGTGDGTGTGAVRGRVVRDDVGHGLRSRTGRDSLRFSDEQRLRIRELEERITCACPRENWSKTLAHCPDGCADAQKEEIRVGILAGQSNREILAAQAQRHGPRALAQPGWEGRGGKLTYLLPVFICIAAVLVAMAVLFVMVRRSGRDGEQEGSGDAASESELAAIELELSELDD